VCSTLNVLGLIRPTQRFRNKTEKGLVTVNATKTRRIRGNRNKYDRMGQYVISRFFILLDQEFHLE